MSLRLHLLDGPSAHVRAGEAVIIIDDDATHAFNLTRHASAHHRAMAYVDGVGTALGAAQNMLFGLDDPHHGRWARLSLSRDGELSGVYRTPMDLFVIRHKRESHHHRPRRQQQERGSMIHANVLPFSTLPRTPAWFAMDALIAARRRRLSALPSGPPYGRLAGCPPEGELRMMPMGFMLDEGFTAAAGGVQAATDELGAALHMLNGLFQDQLGLRLEARYIVVRSSATTSFAEGGPHWPHRRQPGEAEEGVLVNAADPAVLDIAPAFLLGRFAQWIGAHAPDASGRVGLWHLLTDAFPPPGVVGIASVGVACQLGSLQLRYSDTGDAAAADYYPRNAETGNRVDGYTMGSLASFSSASGGDDGCATGSAACVAAAGLSSRSTDTWLTMAHEIGHGLGAQHTFEKGGRMSYGNDVPFVQNGEPYADLCTYIASRVLEGETSATGGDMCMAPAGEVVCGNAMLEVGEECDDGNLQSGDGCSDSCIVECGWRCVRAPPSGGVGSLRSKCSRHCGDGVVQLDLGEECDSAAAACCDSETCRLIGDAVCASGECCDVSTCSFRPAAAPCADGAGFCVDGACERDWQRTLGKFTVGGTVAEVDTMACPINECHFQFSLPAEPPGTPPTCWAYSEAPFSLPDGMPCWTSSGSDSDGGGAGATLVYDGDAAANGRCHGGVCETQPVCGDGKIDIGEDCDDTSPCCSNCRYATGASCSPPGECCEETCVPKPSPAMCMGGEGYCNRGACVSREEAYVCTTYGNLRLNMTACPLTPSQPCVVHCALDADSWNLAEQLAMPSACRPKELPAQCYAMGHIDDGAPCSLIDASGQPSEGVCVGGVCARTPSSLICPSPPPSPSLPPLAPPSSPPSPPTLPPPPPSTPPCPLPPAPPGGYSPPPSFPAPSPSPAPPPPPVTVDPPPDFGPGAPPDGTPGSASPAPPPPDPRGARCAPPPPGWWGNGPPGASPPPWYVRRAADGWAARITRWMKQPIFKAAPFVVDGEVRLPRLHALAIVGAASALLFLLWRLVAAVCLKRRERTAAHERARAAVRAVASPSIGGVDSDGTGRGQPRAPSSRRDAPCDPFQGGGGRPSPSSPPRGSCTRPSSGRARPTSTRAWRRPPEVRAFSPRSFSPPQASSAAAAARRANASPPRSFPSLLTAGDVSTTAGEWSDIELASIAAAPTAPDGETATPPSLSTDEQREERRRRRSAEDFDVLTGSMGFAPEDAARALAAADGDLARAVDFLVNGGAGRAVERSHTSLGAHTQDHAAHAHAQEYI